MTQNQVRFYTELRDCLRTAHSECVKLIQKRDDLQRKERDKILTSEHVKAEVDGIERAIQKVRDDCGKRANSIIDERIRFLDSELALEPSRITEDAELLKFDGLLSQEDIDRLIQRNVGNLTMWRLISSYANAHDMSIKMYPPIYTSINQDMKSAANMREFVRIGIKWLDDAERGGGVLERLFASVGV